ncbi:MAG: hypothetical protein RLO01_12590 [Thalassobaculaceae bacterium]
MHYPDHPTADIQTDPTKPRFRRRDDENGVVGTRVEPDWLNDIMFNLMGPIEATQGVPVKGRGADLVDAIGRMMGGASPAHTMLSKDVAGAAPEVVLTQQETSRIVIALTGARTAGLILTLHSDMPGCRVVRDGTGGDQAVKVKIAGQDNDAAVAVPSGEWAFLITDGATVSVLATTETVAQVETPTYDQIRKPSITSPAAGDLNVGETPTIAGDTYYSLYGIAHASTSVEIATDADFDTVITTQNAFGATSVAVAGGVLSTNTTYFARLRYADALGQLSPWSDTVSFSTGATFIAVAQPTNTAPANAATGVSVTPTLTASAFAVTGGGADTHISTRWRLYRITGPATRELTWDSGEVAAATSVAAPTLLTLTDYEWEVAYRGDLFGWSPWSATTEFTTGQPAGSHVDSTPGARSFTVPAGVYSIRETAFGGGGGGGDGPTGRGTGGGGAGGVRRTRAVVPGQVINYTVAEGGAINTSGGTSSIDGEISATGGQRGWDNGPNPGDGGVGVGGDLNGTGGRGGTSGGENGLDATDIGAGGGAMQGAGGVGGDGVEGGGKGADASGLAEIPGGGGRGRGNSPGDASAGANGQVKFEWGAGI